ncbi:MAG: hypothetical protein QXQ87_02025, partial [Halobacteria archaeon]
MDSDPPPFSRADIQRRFPNEEVDRPRAPRNPLRKATPEHEALIVQLAREDARGIPEMFLGGAKCQEAVGLG